MIIFRFSFKIRLTHSSRLPYMAEVPYRCDCSSTKRFISFTTSSRIVLRNWYHFRLYDRLSVGAKTFLNCDPSVTHTPHITHPTSINHGNNQNLHDWTSMMVICLTPLHQTSSQQLLQPNEHVDSLASLQSILDWDSAYRGTI